MKKNKGTSLTEIIVSIALISMIMIFVFNILVDLKNENEISTENGLSSLEKSSYTRIIQNDLINDKLIGIDVCDEGELCIDLKYENGDKRFKVENDAVIYDDEKWEIESGDFFKNKVQFVYKLATNDEELLSNSNANNYYLLKIVIPDLENIESNRNIDPEITNLGTGKLEIDCKKIKEHLQGAAYVECDGFEFESEEEIEDTTPHTVRVHLGSEWTKQTYNGLPNVQNPSSIRLRAYFSGVTVKAGNLSSNNIVNNVVTLKNVPKGALVTVSTTPSFDSVGNIGYTYTNNNTKRTQQTYNVSVQYRQKTGNTYTQLSGTVSGNTYQFRMPGNDIDIWDDLIVTSRDTKTQNWKYSEEPSWSISDGLTCVLGNPGAGHNLRWAVAYYNEKNGHNSDANAIYLIDKGEITLYDEVVYSTGHGKGRIITKINVRRSGNNVTYTESWRCPDEKCHCVDDDYDKNGVKEVTREGRKAEYKPIIKYGWE